MLKIFTHKTLLNSLIALSIVGFGTVNAAWAGGAKVKTDFPGQYDCDHPETDDGLLQLRISEEGPLSAPIFTLQENNQEPWSIIADWNWRPVYENGTTEHRAYLRSNSFLEIRIRKPESQDFITWGMDLRMRNSQQLELTLLPEYRDGDPFPDPGEELKIQCSKVERKFLPSRYEEKRNHKTKSILRR